MKAFHLSLRHKHPATITRSLAFAVLITFFAAGYADARCQEPHKEPAKL